ncbi:MAG TPA: BTAD domain-containing putative transcriptional regulator [Thermoanaerobaculia bacterium]|nr:BTAD domain-containing putative transcriptional regulator [Thermoanaerobaculia bacterium]
MHSRSADLARPPVSLTTLVGRDAELAEIERIVAGNRLVTLTGVGGTGKTRLAAELALRADWQREDSVAWVELGPCNDPILVAQQAAAALRLRDNTDCGLTVALVDALRDRDLLLIFDNCEHLIGACAELVDTLLAQCDRLRVLATSREPLGVAGERVWPVPPLACPEAAALFADRAAAVDPSFTVNESNEAAVIEICRTLDGIPLAIELAAARVRLLTPQQIAARLEDRFTILSGGARTTVPRHRTLRAAIDWSFALLNEREQMLLARLSVYAGGFSIDCAESVCAGDPIAKQDVLDLLGSLVDKSLVVSKKRDSVVRYSLLETIRQYAAAQLPEVASVHELRRRHATAFLDIVREALPEMMIAAIEPLDRMDRDRDNIRAALAWSVEHEPDAIALPLAAAFRWHWYYSIAWGEGLRWTTRVLERSSPAVTPARASVLTAAGTFAAYLGDLSSGRNWLEEGETMWRALGDDRELALNLSAQAQLLATAGELDAAAARAEESLRLARSTGSSWEIGYCLTNAAAFVAQSRGEFETADRYLQEAELLFSDGGHPLGLPFVLSTRALLALRRRDHAAAARLALKALPVTRVRSDVWFSSRALRVLAYTTTNDPVRAARLLGAADGMLRSICAGMLPHERSEHDRLMATLRETLSAEELEAALRDGRNMSFDEACDFALAIDAAPEITAPAAALHVSDLGPLRITLDGKPLDFEGGRSSGRARELLVFLLLHPEGRRREEVGVAFWPDASSDQVKNSFHVTLHRLRKMLGRADAISNDGGRYRISPELPHTVDSRRFETEVTSALRSSAPLLAQLESALALYHGDFLQGEDAGEWCLATRAHLRQLYIRGLFALGQGLESHGRYSDAADTYTRLVSREPFHEAAWRRLMVCRSRLGARTEALLVYRTLEQRLRDDLAATPEPETSSLYRRLQQNEAV